MLRKIPKNQDFRVPPLPWCEFLILKKVASENGKLTPYKLSQYAEELDECEKSYGTYNNMKRLLQQWKRQGIVDLRPPNQYIRINLIEILPYGADLLKRLDAWYGAPNS